LKRPKGLGIKPKLRNKIMQIKLFTIPIGDSGAALDEMNCFLKGNKILGYQLKAGHFSPFWFYSN